MSMTSITPLDQADARRGADVLLEVLRSEGVRYVFGNPGTTELPLMDALLATPDIRYIWALQEASVVAMADGYAQAARRPGFVNLHTAGGLGHGMGNLLNASVSGTPLVVTAGQQDSRHTITDPLLFGDLVRIAGPAVKWAQEVTSADQLPVLVRRAFHDANAAPTGPVFLSLPMDVMEEMSSVGIAERSVIDRRAVAGALDSLAAHLAAIAPGRLAIIAGDEIYASEAAAEVVALADMLGAPVYGSSWPSRIPFPTTHPLWAGNLPTKATEIARRLEELRRDLRARRQVADHHPLHRGSRGPALLRGVPDVGRRAGSRTDLRDPAVGRRRHQGLARCAASPAGPGVGAPCSGVRRV